jgi:hypothetical protein
MMMKLLIACVALVALAAPVLAAGQTPEGTLTVSATTAAVGANITATASDLYIPQYKKGSYAYIYVECPSHTLYQIIPPPEGSFAFTSQVAEECGVYLIVRTVSPSGVELSLTELGDIDVTFTPT